VGDGTNVNALTFMPIKPGDVPVILEQCRELILHYEDLSQIHFEAVLRWMEQKIKDNMSDYTCVYRDDVPVAFYSLREDEEQTELDDFYVLEPYRNKGIGSEILKNCITKTQQPIYLYVFHANLGAIRLYERYGFVVTQQVSPTRSIMTRFP
jgi:GNAT superfamily N-acetyltransferase